MENDTKIAKLESHLVKIDSFGALMFAGGLILKGLQMELGSVGLIVGISVLALSSVLKGFMRSGLSNQNEIFLNKMICFSSAIGLVSALFILQNWPEYYKQFIVFISAIATLIILALVLKINVLKLAPYNEKIKIAMSFIIYLLLNKF